MGSETVDHAKKLHKVHINVKASWEVLWAVTAPLLGVLC